MKRNFTLLAFVVLQLTFFTAVLAQCSSGRYHDMIFPGAPVVTSAVSYGSNETYQGTTQNLLLDVYEPACDNATSRPCVIYAHGGGFTGGSRLDAGDVAACVALAKLGYVVASIDYRLGFEQTFPAIAFSFNSAINRGVHDARAAVRFMRNNALNAGNTYKIDPNNIFFAGVSAGGIMALHLAYQNTQGEQFSATTHCSNQTGSNCGNIEGISNNYAVPSTVRAVLSIAGGLRDSTWITNNDIPCFLAHGTIDGTVPYASGCFGGFTNPCQYPVQGSYVLNRVMNTKNVTHCFKPLFNQDHIPSNQAYVDTIAVLMRNFLESMVCSTALSCSYLDPPVAATASVTIAVTSGNDTTCSGQPVTFTATGTGGSPVYQWKKNGSNVGSGGAIFTLAAPVNGDLITVEMTSCSGSATSSPITMSVTSASAPAVSIAVSSGSINTCAGSPITFAATPTNGGTSPTYQWKKNGSSVGTGATFTLASPANNDVITVVMTSNSPCANPLTATSNAMTVTITANQVPAVSIALASGSSNPTCTGVPVSFTATPTNGGTSPSYQWKKNGTNAGTGSTFTLTSPANNDIITVVMTSNSSCANPTTATSNAITVTVSATVAPTVAIAITAGDDTVCTGTSVTFAATPNMGGSAPTYQWKKNGTNAGTGSTFTLASPANNDVITVVMTSNSSCASPNTATSNALTMVLSPVPTITKSGNVLTSSANGSNQWHLNGQPIAGALNKTYTATASGSYTVKVGKCTSLPVSVTITGVEELQANNNLFSVYPNPSDGNFNLSFTSAVKQTYDLEIKNILGALILHETLTDFTGDYSRTIAIGEYGKGIYLVTLKTSNNEVTKRVFVY